MKYYGVFDSIKENLNVIESEIYEGYFARFYHKFCGIMEYDLEAYIEEGFLCGKGTKILELACGTGRVTIPLLKKGFKVKAIDLSEDMLNVLEDNMKAIPRRYRKNLDRECKNILAIDYENEFDLIIFPATTICLLEEKQVDLLFEVVYKALKPGGKFMFDYVKEDKLGKGLKELKRLNVKIDEGENCIYQEFKNYDEKISIVNFYVEKEKEKYLSSTTKNMVAELRINNAIKNSRFSFEKLKKITISDYSYNDISMNVLYKEETNV